MKAKVNLISLTPDALPLMCWAHRVMHAKVPDDLNTFKKNAKRYLGMSANDYINNVLLKDGMPTFLEYINLTFKLENVSRSLTHQLVRHRIGFSYSQQSMRCVSVENFANDHAYYMPENVKDKEAYHLNMVKIQELYNKSLADGVSIQDARGLLPQNIFTTITFSCSLRAFIGMINKRLCWKVQDEFRSVAELMLDEIKRKMDKRILQWIGAPCKVSNYKYCMMAGECEQQYKAGKLTGSQNTDHCCPIYVNKFIKK